MAAPDYPAGFPEESLALMTRFVQVNWGTENVAQLATPDQLGNSAFLRWFAKGARLYMRPSEASRVMYYQQSLDVRDALRPLGIEIRAGLHTGEVEVMQADIAGSESTLPPESLKQRDRVSCSSLRQCPCSWLGRDSSSGTGVNTCSRVFREAGGCTQSQAEGRP
jgi:hypothetical protein